MKTSSKLAASIVPCVDLLHSRIESSAGAKRCVADLKAAGIALPPGVEADDLIEPTRGSYDKSDKWIDGNAKTHFVLRAEGYGHETIEMWFCSSMGWVIPTLLIAKAGRRRASGTADRTYAVSLKGSLCRVGFGPHVKARVTLHVRKGRAPITALVLLRAKGGEDANTTRDRISSRRAEGSVMRAQGRSSWRWSV